MANTSDKPIPAWVEYRPASNVYYIGIGIAPKTIGADYRKAAKQNALSDLASEIKVSVNSNSLLHTLEQDYKFEQEFKESIRTNSNLDLQDFEAVDTWEDANSLWAYYRLNKDLYAEVQRQKKETAHNVALDFLAKATSAEKENRFAAAVDNYCRGLQALEPFWNENNEVSYEGKNILLDNSLFTGLNDLISQSKIAVADQLLFNYDNRFKLTTSITVFSAKTGLVQENVPLRYEYYGSYGKQRGKIISNSAGTSSLTIAEIDKSMPNNSLLIEVDNESLFEPFQSDAFMRKLTASLNPASARARIIHQPPVIFIAASESNLGKDLSGKPIASAITASLARKGFAFANNAKESDLILHLDASSVKAGSSQGFSSATLTVNIEVRQKDTSEVRYKMSKSDIKGVDLNYEKAGMKAYQNFTKNIESELMRKLVNDLF